MAEKLKPKFTNLDMEAALSAHSLYASQPYEPDHKAIFNQLLEANPSKFQKEDPEEIWTHRAKAAAQRLWAYLDLISDHPEAATAPTQTVKAPKPSQRRWAKNSTLSPPMSGKPDSENSAPNQRGRSVPQKGTKIMKIWTICADTVQNGSIEEIAYTEKLRMPTVPRSSLRSGKSTVATKPCPPTGVQVMT